MVELRKRKAGPAEPAAPPPLKKSNSSASKAQATAPEKKDFSSAKFAVADFITLDGFGGEIDTNDGKKTTLKTLIADSKSGVVLFTYPKASTPGCTNQACLFRDEFALLTATGYAIYGLSTDSPKSNTTFKNNQKLPYTLLCDPSASLIEAIGMKKASKGTTRGVVVISKVAKVEVVFAGGPAATVDEVRSFISTSMKEADVDVENVTDGKTAGKTLKAVGETTETKGQESEELKQSEMPAVANGDKAQAEVAAEVADSAEILDHGV
ncbi:hypothetical protein MMC07_008544 [Pseudocyphellaria aurata]|nr:hypothetical protein [Pseudocyphellaria aurata]